MAMMLAVGAMVVPGAASAATGDVGIEGPSHSGTGTPTGTKRATSNLWFHDGLWWGNLWDTASADFHIFKFNSGTNSWVDTGVATDTRASTHHDVLWDGTTLHVASYRFVNDGLPAEPNFPTTMKRYSYNASSKTYTLLSTTQINNSKVEVLTIDKDTTGRVWATWQQGNRIYLNVTGTDGKTWGTPFAHPASLSNVSVDDTSALIAYGPGKMGLMWSRQVGDSTDGMYFSFHIDGAANNSWSTPVAAVSGQRSGDDHMNLKWLDSSGGRVFAAIKTSFTTSSQPLIQLLALDNTSSTWTKHTIATVAECPNRVIVLIDEAAQKLRTFATYPKPSGTTNAGACTSSGGAIYEKSSPLDGISFTTTKTPRIVDADQYVHNVTSTKQNLNARGTANSGLLLLADVNATSRYWHYYDGTGGVTPGDTTAPTVSDISPTANATNVVTTANVTGTFSEAMTASTITTSTFTLTSGSTTVPAAVTYSGNVATLNPTNDLTAGTTYTATIKGGTAGVKDAAGNALAQDRTWTFTTASAAPGDTTAPTVTAVSPTAGATGVAATANASGTFSEAMTASTINSSTFTLTPQGSTTAVGAAVTYSSTDRVATLNPTADLAAGTTYTATIKGGTAGVKDAAGNALAADRTWTFTTASAAPGDTTAPTVTAVSPTAGATGVVAASNVTGTFSEPMDAASVTSSTFTLTSGSTTVPAAVTYSGNVATLNPTADLAADTTYTATIKGGTDGVKDAAGNALAADRTWTFTTAAAGGGTPETVTLSATADSYVVGGTTTNFGSSTLLGVDSSPVEITYLKFDLSAYAGRTLDTATLQLNSAGSGSVGTQNVKLAVSDSWTETGITFANKPALGTSLGTLGPTAVNTRYSVPLTVSGLSGELGGELSLGLDSTSSDGLDLNSKEAGSTVAPKLVLTFK